MYYTIKQIYVKDNTFNITSVCTCVLIQKKDVSLNTGIIEGFGYLKAAPHECVVKTGLP